MQPEFITRGDGRDVITDPQNAHRQERSTDFTCSLSAPRSRSRSATIWRWCRPATPPSRARYHGIRRSQYERFPCPGNRGRAAVPRRLSSPQRPRPRGDNADRAAMHPARRWRRRCVRWRAISHLPADTTMDSSALLLTSPTCAISTGTAAVRDASRGPAQLPACQPA